MSEPAYSIKIEPAATGTSRISITHIGPLAPLIADLLEKHPAAKERVEAADARPAKKAGKPRAARPLRDDEFGGL